MNKRDSAEERESRRILERVDAETESRMRPDRDAGDEWAEYWGRRIGRVLSYLLLLVAVYWIYQFLVESGIFA